MNSSSFSLKNVFKPLYLLYLVASMITVFLGIILFGEKILIARYIIAKNGYYVYYKKAKEYLELAFNFKEFRYKVIPYLAECYFYERNFKKVKELFSQLDLSLDVKVNFMKQFWSMQ